MMNTPKKKLAIASFVFFLVMLVGVVSIIRNKVLYKSGATSAPTQSISGTLLVVVSDDIKNSSSKTSYYIDSTPVNYIGTKKLISGAKVNAVGVMNSSKVFEINEANGGVISPSTFNSQASAGTQSVVTGARKVAVVMLNWSDLPAMPYPTRADVLNMFSPTNVSGVRYFYKTSSFNQLDLALGTNVLADGDVFGWYTTNVSSGGSLTTLCQKFNALKQSGELRSWLATNHPEIVNANYQNIIYMMPTNFNGTGSCTSNALYGGNIVLIDSYIFQPQFGYNLTGTIVHELGHNFGELHSSSLFFSYPITSIASGQSYDEYGDYWEVMGKNSYGIFDFSAYHKNMFGWLTSNNIQDVLASTSNGIYTYTLSPIEVYATGKQMLRVFRDTTSYYVIENRALLGVDSDKSPSYGVQEGAMIRLYDNVHFTAYNTMTDTFLPRTMVPNYTTWPVGSILEDTEANLKIFVQSKVNNVLTIVVEKGVGVPPTLIPSTTPEPCTVAVSPTTLNLSIGGTASFTASVTSGLGSATVTQWNYVALNPNIVSVDSATKRVTALAVGTGQVAALANLSDSRYCSNPVPLTVTVTTLAPPAQVSLVRQFGPVSKWLTAFDLAHGWTVASFVRTTGDVNGDGRADLVGFGQDGVYVSLTNATGTGFSSPIAKWTSAFDLSHGWSVKDFVRTTGDVNGDGKDDLVGFGQDGVYVALSTGTGFGTISKWTSSFDLSHGWTVASFTRTVGDVNGDGKDDLVGFGQDGVYVALSTGTGFGTISKWTASFKPEDGWSVSGSTRVVGDVNNDRLFDLIGFKEDGVYVAISTGTGFGPLTKRSGDYKSVDGWTNSASVRTIGDVNGDGYMDIVGFGSTGVYASNSTGTSFGPIYLAGSIMDAAHGWNVTNFVRTVGDVTGDGKIDLVGFGQDGVYVSK
ncbi:VCBS repeat-containing protein [Candidatus Shapirobacteria bacterium]|nr:VCBS repeat-containing protein [Candidatus Shapirobacteria bacterium]